MKIDSYMKHLEDLTKTKTHYADVYNNYGLVLAHLEKNAEALEAFGKALEINPHYVEARVSRCFITADQGRVTQGFRDFKRLHVRSPHDMRVLLSLGIFCMRYGWKESGLPQIMRAAKMSPGVPFLQAYAAAALLDAGDEDGSRTRLEKAVAGCREAGIELETQGKADAFPNLEVYRRWDNPYTSWRVRLLFANFLAERGDIERARAEFLSIHSTFPGHVEAMLGLGQVAQAQNRSDEAATWFLRAATVDSDSHKAMIDLAFILAEKGDMEKALGRLQKAVALRPLFPDYRYHLGLLLLDLGRADEAVMEFKRSLTMNPQYGIASIHLARAHLEKGNAEDALKALTQGFCDDWPETLMIAAQAYSKLGRKEEAVRSLEKALTIDPSHTEAKELLKSLSRSH